MAGCREPYDVLFVDNKCNLMGVIGLRIITNHLQTPCMAVIICPQLRLILLIFQSINSIQEFTPLLWTFLKWICELY